MEFPPPPKADLRVDISADEVAFYAEHGYLACAQVSPPEELAWLIEVYDTLLAQPRSGFLDGVFDLGKPYGSKAPPQIGQLLFPERLVPAIRETAMWQNARRIAVQLLGAPAAEVESWGHVIYKEGNGDNETPWHQDEAYWDVKMRYHALGAWMPLQDVDVDNGCLWFLPGSHKGDVRNHRHFGDDPAVHLLEVTESPDTTGAVPVPLAAGGMTFHHPRMLHYARPNTSGRIRRAWANEFQTAPEQRDVPADYPWVKAGIDAMAQSMSKRDG